MADIFSETFMLTRKWNEVNQEVKRTRMPPHCENMPRYFEVHVIENSTTSLVS